MHINIHTFVDVSFKISTTWQSLHVPERLSLLRSSPRCQDSRFYRADLLYDYVKSSMQ